MGVKQDPPPLLTPLGPEVALLLEQPKNSGRLSQICGPLCVLSVFKEAGELSRCAAGDADLPPEGIAQRPTPHSRWLLLDP